MAKIKDLGGANKKELPSLAPPILSEYEEFKGLLMNALTIKGTTFEEEQFIKNQLIENNCIGYDLSLGIWATIAGLELNDYNLPKLGEFIFPHRGRSFKRVLSYSPTADGAYYILGIPSGTTFAKIIKQATETLELCDVIIRQNLNASKTPEIIIVRDEDMRLSVLHALQQQQNGAPAIVADASVGEALKGVPMNTPYIVDAVYQFRQQIRDGLMNKLGTMSANINKRERVQVGEVNATVGQCEDYIYMLIDNFNKQMKSYRLPFTMELSNSLEELYTTSSEVKEIN